MCCLLVLDSLTSTPQWIQLAYPLWCRGRSRIFRQPAPVHNTTVGRGEDGVRGHALTRAITASVVYVYMLYAYTERSSDDVPLLWNAPSGRIVHQCTLDTSGPEGVTYTQPPRMTQLKDSSRTRQPCLVSNLYTAPGLRRVPYVQYLMQSISKCLPRLSINCFSPSLICSQQHLSHRQVF